MTFKDSLTPRDTEEVKPGLFIKKTRRGYTQVHPAVWDGKINWNNLLFGGSIYKTFSWFLILLFLIWSYNHDVQEYKNFYLEVRSSPANWCAKVASSLEIQDCTEIQRRGGICVDSGLDLGLGLNITDPGGLINWKK